jgi:predicted phosphodiesterase
MTKKFQLSTACASLAPKREPLVIDEPGKWLVLSDIHFPYHSELALNSAVQFGLEDDCDCVLLNGDILDCAQISRFVAERGAVDLIDEIDMTRAFLADLSKAFPKGRIIFKTGNHEDRLHTYLMGNARQAAKLRYMDWPSQLGLPELDIEFVGNKRKIYMGDLTVVHGHEFSGGGGVNPARWLYLQISDCGLMGHLHRSSSHKGRRVRGYVASTWSTGCLCDLSPTYAACNQWDHGFGTIELRGGGDFQYTPHEVLPSGKVR